MALPLLLRSSGMDPCPRVECDAPRFVLGRAAGCDLQLPDPSVSRRHATIRQRGSHYILVDEGSENGTFVGAERLTSFTPHRIQSGDAFRVGRVWLQVAKSSKTGVLSAAGRELSRQLVSHSLREADLAAELLVRVEDPQASTGLELSLPNHDYTIGRSRSADLTVKEPTLAPKALHVQRTGDKVKLLLLDQGVDILLGSKPLTPGQRLPWSHGVLLTLGQQRLLFEDPVAAALSAIESNPTERIADGEEIKAPRGCKPKPPAAPSPQQAVKPPERPQGIPNVSRPRSQWARSAGSERFTLADGVIVSLALGVAGLSWWAMHWVVHFNPV